MKFKCKTGIEAYLIYQCLINIFPFEWTGCRLFQADPFLKEQNASHILYLIYTTYFSLTSQWEASPEQYENNILRFSNFHSHQSIFEISH